MKGNMIRRLSRILRMAYVILRTPRISDHICSSVERNRRDKKILHKQPIQHSPRHRVHTLAIVQLVVWKIAVDVHLANAPFFFPCVLTVADGVSHGGYDNLACF
jgi:hypothetical protein